MSVSESLQIRFTNARGYPVGTSNGRCKFSDETVGKARAMRAAGAHYHVIAAAIGCAIGTVHAWCNGRRRNPHARIVVKRVKTTPDLSKSFDANHQQTGDSQANMRVSGQVTDFDTDKPTDID